MTTYNFTVVLEGDVEGHLDGLFEAGCDDATFGSVDGIPYADFDREAASFSDAITTSIRDVESVGGLRVRRIEPDDLVTTAEIAARLHRTRESVRLLAAGKRGSKPFPAPVSHLRRRTRLWRWSDIAAWAGAGPETDAQLVAALNAALELREATPAVRKIAESAVGYTVDTGASRI